MEDLEQVVDATVRKNLIGEYINNNLHFLDVPKLCELALTIESTCPKSIISVGKTKDLYISIKELDNETLIVAYKYVKEKINELNNDTDLGY